MPGAFTDRHSWYLRRTESVQDESFHYKLVMFSYAYWSYCFCVACMSKMAHRDLFIVVCLSSHPSVCHMLTCCQAPCVPLNTLILFQFLFLGDILPFAYHRNGYLIISRCCYSAFNQNFYIEFVCFFILTTAIAFSFVII